MREYVDIHTPAGTFTVDFTASEAGGYVDIDEDRASGETIEAVQANVRFGHALLDAGGRFIVIMPEGIQAYTYRLHNEEF